MSSAPASRPRIAFLGTPEFAVTPLAALVATNQYEVAFVITETDKPAGRGHKVVASPVKTYALDQGIPVLQPSTLRGLGRDSSGNLIPKGDEAAAFVASLNHYAPIDVMISAAYGKMLPSALLRWPRIGILNIHASLLPRWRGAAPIHRALFAGDRETGVCIMQTERALDTGPVFAEARIGIEDDDTFQSLHDRLAILGAELLTDTLPDILSGTRAAVPQPEEGVTYAEKWLASDRDICWSEPAQTTLRRIRTCAPQPGARSWLGDQQVKVLAARQVQDQNFPRAEPGCVVEVNKAELIVAVGEHEYIAIEEMQFPGKSRLPIRQILTGRIFTPADRFR